MKSYKDFKIGTKLYTGFGVVLLLLVIVAYMSNSNLSNTTTSFKNLIEDDLFAKSCNANIKSFMLQARRSEKDFLLRKELKYKEKVEEAINNLNAETQVLLAVEQEADNKMGIDDANSIFKYADIYLLNFKKLVKAWKIKGLDQNSGLQGKFRKAAHELAKIIESTNTLQLQVNLLTIRKHEKDYLMRKDEKYITKNINEIATLKLNTTTSKLTGNDKKAIKIAAETYERDFLALIEQDKIIVAETENMRDAIHNLEPIIEKGYKRASNKAVAKTTTTINTAYSQARNPIILSILALIFGSFIAFYVAHIISKPIKKISSIADDIALGNINHDIDIKSNDEIGMLANSFRMMIAYMKELAQVADSIAHNDLSVTFTPKSEHDTLGQSFKTMLKSLSAVIQQINNSSTQVASAATEISSSSDQVAQNASNQEMQISQITTAIEEMAATIVETSQNASEATNGAQTASDTAGEGGQIVGETIEGMNRIASVVQESAKNIHQLAESAKQIGEIISVIDDIADQTNLLALNAAIEAARAGEQGRGFAVVADEVRKLAERTGKATGEITKMIKGIQTGTEDAVKSMDQGSIEVNSGRELVDKAGDSLSHVMQNSQEVMNMILQIATATEEQSAAAEEISKNIEMVSTATRESATGAEQSSAAAVQLSQNAEELQNIVGKFKLN